MRLTIPKVTTPRSTRKKDIGFRIAEMVWHTIIPVACTYIMMRHDFILMAIPILTVLIVRFEGFERQNKNKT